MSDRGGSARAGWRPGPATRALLAGAGAAAVVALLTVGRPFLNRLVHWRMLRVQTREAQALLDRGRPEAAIAAADEVLAIAPEHECLILRACALAEAGHPAEAETDLEAVERAHVPVARFHAYLAQAAWRVGDRYYAAFSGSLVPAGYNPFAVRNARRAQTYLERALGVVDRFGDGLAPDQLAPVRRELARLRAFLAG